MFGAQASNSGGHDHREIMISVDRGALPGFLDVPEQATGIVIFAHGSGSSRMSPRNLEVAAALNQAGIATLLFDLLLPQEEDDRTNVFDIPLLAERLELATQWVREQSDLASLKIGYFGASTGAGAALMAAAELSDTVAAVVSRGGRPDLAGRTLEFVKAPALLIVGGADTQVVALNSRAYDRIPGERRLAVVPNATHLFEEPGAMDTVIRLAIEWFTKQFSNWPGPASSR
jgi:putative phosphoribosyl transferase